MTAYQQLESSFRRYFALKGASAILGWDNATMMPENSGDTRAEQLGALAETAHEIITQPALAEWFAKADSSELDSWQQANLREMKRSWHHETAVPADLVSAFTKACVESEQFWRVARKTNNFKAFLPYQERVLSLVREVAQAKAQALGISAYDALLDQYDPGTSQALLDPLFNDLAGFLPSFIQSVMERQQSLPAPLPIQGHFPTAKQKALGLHFMQLLGFDFTRGRLDESTHPFCGGVPGDIRLTTRYDEEDFLSGFFGVMHESGHALYEMGLPAAWRNLPVGEARGMAFHESQSLLTEMQLCISRDFLTFAAPVIGKQLGVSGPEWSADNIFRLMTRVQPSLIRVDADEATYPAHIILRYRLEKQMIAGSLSVADLPEAWRAGMKELLGITPDNDAQGCMQDIHWPDGAFGYFPTYTMGAIIAAQLFAAARKAIPNLSEKIQKGEFIHLYKWLRENVHSQGSKLTAIELLKHATGQTLDVSVYKEHLKHRYLGSS
ncbi:MAG: carboxypeptidase M32 [Rickettsiales bacterium]|nr:carboxypeptidase M32 [Rickettsiales bacterium]